MRSGWSIRGYCSARAAEERAHASTSRTQLRRLERLALAERWERRANEATRGLDENADRNGPKIS